MVQPADGPLRFRFDAEQSPERDNRVTLTRDRDRFGVPRLELRFRVSSSDHDAQNLFLAGSAVFPTSGAMGPTLTIVALSVRIAEAVRAEVRPTGRTGGAR